MQKSDWRKIQDMLPALRERFLLTENRRLIQMLADSRLNETERFWKTHDETKRIARELRDCLDGHSRSSMDIYMALMRRVGMLRDEDLVGFSDELREQLLNINSGVTD